MATPPEETSRPAYGYTAGSTLDLARLPIPATLSSSSTWSC